MDRINYRRVLPVVQLGAYSLMIWFGCPYRDTWTKWLNPTTGIAWSWIDGPPSILEQLAWGINLPTMLLLPMLFPFENSIRTGAGRELLMHIVTVTAVPVLWYFIGLRIDNRHAISLRFDSRPVRVLIWVAAICLGLLMATLLASFFLGGIEFIVGRVFALVWVAIGIRLLTNRIRYFRTIQIT